MPELPEVETVRRGLAPVMAGALFVAVEARRPDLRIPLPADFEKRLKGACVRALERRGKFLLAPLSSGETLIMHLGMSGRFTVTGGADRRSGGFYRAAPPNPAHDHVLFTLETSGARSRVVFNDPRRFGLMDIAADGDLASCRHFRDMGPEPLSEAFTGASLAGALARRSAPIKAALLDQRVVAGLGNIYASEALHRAGVSPRRRANSLSARRAGDLRDAIRAVLEEAIEAGGSTLRDFAAADGALGYFQHRFSVYDRTGEPCRVCGKTIRRLVQSGRSTFYCGGCQR